MKTAIIGLGVIGKVHYQVLQELSNAPIAICDVDESKMEGYVGARFTDYRKMIDEIKPDVVHICTPHYLHAEMIVYALERNVNVLCEKPLCISREQIEQVLSAEKNSQAILGVCHQNRYLPSNTFAKQYIEDKKLLSGYGTVVWKRDKAYYDSAEWRGKWKTEGGGVLINQALHTLDLLQWISGFPSKVSASVNTLNLSDVIEVEDSAIAVYYGDVQTVFTASTAGGADFPVELVFRTDTDLIRVYGDQVFINGKQYEFKEQPFFGKKVYGSGHKGLISHFYECVCAKQKFWINGEEGSKVVRMILGAYESNAQKIDL